MSSPTALLVRIGEQELPPHPVTKDTISIGRDPENDVVISHPQVSRRHARLYRSGSGWLVENLSQSNPARLHGQALYRTAPLQPGEVLMLGSLVTVWLASPGLVAAGPAYPAASGYNAGP